MYIIIKKSFSHTVYKISSKRAFLTFDLELRSKVIAPTGSQYMNSYMYTIQKKSLSPIVCKISMKRTFLTSDLDLRSNLTLTSGQRSQHQIEAHI